MMNVQEVVGWMAWGRHMMSQESALVSQTLHSKRTLPLKGAVLPTVEDVS